MKPVPFQTIFLSLLVREALWFGIGQRGFVPEENTLQKAARFPSDCC